MTTWVHASCECCVKLFRFGMQFGAIHVRDLAGNLITSFTTASPPLGDDCHDFSLGFKKEHYFATGPKVGKLKSDGTPIWETVLSDVFNTHAIALNRDESILYVGAEGKQIPTLKDDLYAFNTTTGAITASKRVTGIAVTPTAFSTIGDVAVDDAGNVYVVTGEGDLVKFGPGLAGSGTTLFSVVSSVVGRAISSVDVDSGANPDILIVGNDDESGDLITDRTIWLLDSTGSVIWKQLRGSGTYQVGVASNFPIGGAALDGVGGAYVSATLFSSKAWWKFRQSDGVELWSTLASFGAKIDVDSVHVIGGGNGPVVLDSSTGSVVFDKTTVSPATRTGRLRKLR